MRLIVKLLILTLAVGSIQSCVSKKKYDELVAAKAATDQALAETQMNLKKLQDEKNALAAEFEAEKTRLNGELGKINSELSATKGQIAQVQEKLNMTQSELNALRSQIDGIFATYKDSGLTLEDRDGRLYVMTSKGVNYKSGSKKLSRDQRNALDELAVALKKSPNAKILVEGHTDSKQYAKGSGYDNWDLSFDRAKEVVKYLTKKGVSSKQLTIAGKGENLPAGDNSTSEGRAKNRRTEIVPNPDLGGMMKKD